MIKLSRKPELCHYCYGGESETVFGDLHLDCGGKLGFQQFAITKIGISYYGLWFELGIVWFK